MIKKADILPIFFDPLKNGFKQDVNYIQRFYITDKILVQIFVTGSSIPYGTVNDKVSDTNTEIVFKIYDVNENIKMYYASISNLDESIYTITLEGEESEPFEITSGHEVLDETTLIKISHKDNNSFFDNIFWIEGEQQFIEFRVESGFSPDGYSGKVDNEQFRNQFQEIVELYSVPYDTFSLILGSASGIPYWIIQFINKALCVSKFEVNGKNYVRSGNSVPEKTAISEDGQMFIGSILLEPLKNDISGIGGAPGSASQGTISLMIENPKDGEILQYDSTYQSFKNTNTLEVQ